MTIIPALTTADETTDCSPGFTADRHAACTTACDHRMRLSRRAAIGAGAVAGAALFTACGSDDSPAPAAAGATGGSTGPLASSDAVPAGGSLIVTANNTAYALAKNADGTIVVHSAICTHQGCTVIAAGAELDCNCHGSKFDAFTGAVLNGPAGSPLAEVAVTDANGSITLA